MKEKATLGAVFVLTVVLLSLTVQAPANSKKGVLTIHNFNVEIDGVVVGGFKEVDGMNCETEVIEFRHPDNTIDLLAGATRCGPLVLKRGLAEGPELWNWYEKVMSGVVERKTGSIIMYDTSGVVRGQFDFFDAWPAKWTGPTLDASKSELAIEEVLVVFEHGDWVTP